MGEQYRLCQLRQGCVDSRLLFIDVESRPGDDSFFKSIDQRSFIDNRTTSSINELGRGAHQSQFLRANQMVGGWCERHMNRHDIGLTQEFLQRSILPLARERRRGNQLA